MTVRRPLARADRTAALPARARAKLCRSLAFWLSRRTGQVAVEFALVAPVFLLFALMSFEIGLDLLTIELMDDAVHDAARLMRIGTITGSSYSSALTTAVCNVVVTIPSCSTNIQTYVAAAASGSPAGTGFGSLSGATISHGTMTSTLATLAANDDVLLEIGYNRPWAVGWLFDVTGSNTTFLISSFVFQTEPY